MSGSLSVSGPEMLFPANLASFTIKVENASRVLTGFYRENCVLRMQTRV